MGLSQSHDAVEAPTGSEQSFHSADSGSPDSVCGMSPDKRIGPSFPGKMRLDLEERGLGSQQDQPVSKLFLPSGIIPALRSQRLKKSDTSQVGDCSPMSSTIFGIEVSPSAGQEEETSSSEKPYQRDEAFVDQSDGYTIEVVNEVAQVKSDPSARIAGGDDDRSDLKEEHGKGGSTVPSDSKRSYDCKYCSKKFSTWQALGGHQGSHKKERRHSKGSHECQYCSKKFSTGKALGGHQKGHKKERQQAESARSQASRSAVNQSMGTIQACSACNRCKTCSCLLGEDIEARDGL